MSRSIRPSKSFLFAAPACWALCWVVATTAPSAFAQNRAGQVMAIVGNVTATDAQGQQRVLERGSEIRQGDRIATAEGAVMQVRTVDGGYLSVRSATEMAIERFNYDEKESANSGIVMSLIKGGFRSITGLIGRTNPNAYAVRTSTATVGIRGTDHEPMVILPPALGGAPSLPGAAPGLYDKVNDGETFIRTQQGVLALTKGQIGFTPPLPDRPPQILPTVPEFYRIEVKTDARDPRDSLSQRTSDADGKGGGTALRPSVAARREALKDAAAVAPATAILKDAAVVSPVLTTITKDAAVLTSPLTTTNTTTTLIDSTQLTSPLTTTTSTTTLKDATVLTSPLTTTNSTTTLIDSTQLTSPLTTTTSTTTLKDATVLTSPLTTTTTTLTSPITTSITSSTLSTTIAPTTTTTTTTTTSTLKSVITSPTLTTTIKSTLTK